MVSSRYHYYSYSIPLASLNLLLQTLRMPLVYCYLTFLCGFAEQTNVHFSGVEGKMIWDVFVTVALLLNFENIAN